MFQISTRLRYGLRALTYLSTNGGSGTVSLHEISKNEGISRKYLENIFKLLKKSKITRSVRGREGGYALIKKPEEIGLYEIATALEGKVSLLECIDEKGLCENSSECGVRDFWSDYQDYVKKYMLNLSLADIIEKYYKKI
ncbi:MAG: Rrf2 family transcriptional regulator [Spirochaetia bacterium]|jgi:Rrf2 family protein|nr:Rrf2 family transcriptional regulator [Spirochaetia bacterium]